MTSDTLDIRRDGASISVSMDPPYEFTPAGLEALLAEVVREVQSPTGRTIRVSELQRDASGRIVRMVTYPAEIEP